MTSTIDDNNYQDFEDHEVYSDLIEKQNYEGLILFCKNRLKSNPDDVYGQCRLGEAYVLNGEYEEAIYFVTPYLKGFPDNEGFQSVVLDSLYKLGRTENDYDWIQKPDIVELNNEILNYFYDLLKPKRKPRSIYILYGELYMKGYVRFSENDLLAAFKKDARFMVNSQNEIMVS